MNNFKWILALTFFSLNAQAMDTLCVQELPEKTKFFTLRETPKGTFDFYHFIENNNDHSSVDVIYLEYLVCEPRNEQALVFSCRTQSGYEFNQTFTPGLGYTLEVESPEGSYGPYIFAEDDCIVL